MSEDLRRVDCPLDIEPVLPMGSERLLLDNGSPSLRVLGKILRTNQLVDPPTIGGSTSELTLSEKIASTLHACIELAVGAI